LTCSHDNASKWNEFLLANMWFNGTTLTDSSSDCWFGPIQTVSSYSYFLFVGGLMSYLFSLWLFAHRGVQPMLCCVLVFISSSCCQFLWIVHFLLPLLVFSANVYLLEALLTWTNNRSFRHFFCFRKKRTHSSSSSYTLSSSKHSTLTLSEWISYAVNRNDDIDKQNSSSSDIMYEPNNHLSNECLGNISHFSELSATCQTIPDLKECNYINEIGFTRTSIVDFDLKSDSEVNNN
jgi:hypothetical protein